MQKFNISHEYEIDLWDEGVYDREGLDIAWICACLNPMRYSIERKMNLFQKNFKLSPFHVLYFHLLNESLSFIDGIIGTRDLPTDDSRVSELLDSPVSLSGNWDNFCSIVKAHGVVPLHAMPGGEIHAHRTDMMTVLSNCLLFHAKALRDCSENDIASVKSAAVEAVKGVLADCLGTPPEHFNWNYKDKDGFDHRLINVSPTDFYRDCCDFDVDGCAVVYDKVLKGIVPENENVLFADASRLAHLSAASISMHGQMVIVGADTRHRANKLLGILDTDFNDSISEFGSEISMSKGDSVAYKRIAVTDYLTLDGVQSDGDGAFPLRFKAQDSRGAVTGADGHYTMSTDWFKEYVLFIIISKHFVSDK